MVRVERDKRWTPGEAKQERSETAKGWKSKEITREQKRENKWSKESTKKATDKT